MSNSQIDPRRPDRVKRYKSSYSLQFSEDQLQEYMNVLGMIFSMCGLMMKVKWCAWMSVCCSFVGFANAKGGEDTKQVLSCFMLSISSVVMSYLQNPAPMTLPFQ